MRRAPAWAAVRIVHYETDKAPLLLGAIGPLVAQLKSLGASRALFRPHWRQGPHADFALWLDEEREGGFPSAALDHITSWLRSHPSTVALDARAYLRLSLRRARAEGTEGPFLPLLTNNTVIPLVAVHRQSRAGDADEVRDALHATALPQLIALAETKGQPVQFWGALAQMMMCVAQFSGPAGMRGGHLSYRSHAEGFLAGAPIVRSRFETFSRGLHDEIVQRIGDVHRAFAPDGTFTHDNPTLTAWVETIRCCRRALEQIHPRTLAGASTPAPADVADRGRSVFEATIRRGALRRLHGNSGFMVYRALLNHVYGLLPTIGVSPLERFALCYAMAEASETVFAVDWRRYLAGGNGWVRRISGGLRDS